MSSEISKRDDDIGSNQKKKEVISSIEDAEPLLSTLLLLAAFVFGTMVGLRRLMCFF